MTESHCRHTHPQYIAITQGPKAYYNSMELGFAELKEKQGENIIATTKGKRDNRKRISSVIAIGRTLIKQKWFLFKKS